jgi:hypothetical protein
MDTIHPLTLGMSALLISFILDGVIGFVLALLGDRPDE